MNYGFNLYGFNPDFINASNAARQRNAQEEALKQQQMNQMYNIWGQYGQQRKAALEAQKARENAAIEAQKARQFQAEQNELNRAQREKEMAMQQAYNEALFNRKQREYEETKKTANDTAYADLVTQADDLNSQIALETNPVIKKTLENKLNTVKTKMKALGDDYSGKYSWDDTAVNEAKMQQRRADSAIKASASSRRELERDLPLKFNTEEEKLDALTRADNWHAAGLINDDDYGAVVDRINGYESTQEKIAKATQGVVASKAGEQTGKNIDEKTIKNKANTAISESTPPSSLEDGVEDYIIKTLGKTWNKSTQKWE